jgi:hypothetical protein
VGVPGEITIPAGTLSGSVTLTALVRPESSGRETAKMTLVAKPDYKLGKKKSAKVAIINIP